MNKLNYVQYTNVLGKKRNNYLKDNWWNRIFFAKQLQAQDAADREAAYNELIVNANARQNQIEADTTVKLNELQVSDHGDEVKFITVALVVVAVATGIIFYLIKK